MRSVANRKLEWRVIVTVLVSMASGCRGEPGPARYPVEGIVSFDDKPLPEGYIIFYPTDNGRDADTATIHDGKFTLRATEGPKRVEITAQRAIPGTKSPLGGPEVEQYIPIKYNRNSELEAHVDVEAENQFKFPLKSH